MTEEVPEVSSSAGRRRAAQIYGTVLTAAVITAGGNVLSTASLAVTVLVTLVIYWLADQYALLIGEHIHEGRLPDVRLVRLSLAASWPMVAASFVPLAALVVTRVAGASTSTAAEAALLVTLVLLVAHGYAAGRAAGLRGARLLGVVVVAALLGVSLVVLKAQIHGHR